MDVSRLDSTELVDLFAAVLVNGTNHLLRRGLAQGYETRSEDIPGVRGRVDIGQTVRRMLTVHGKSHCTMDELTVDILPNQILRATVVRLLSIPTLDRELKGSLRLLRRELAGISDTRLTKQSFRRIELQSNSRFYRFLLSICELVLDSTLLDEHSGDHRFRDFVRDPKKMAKLFENFVLNFYRIHKQDVTVGREHLRWDAASETDPELSYLPRMETDITLRTKSRLLVIDTKFYQAALQEHYDTQKIHSENLYQIFSYLKNLEVRPSPDDEAEGMLLYPATGRPLRLSYRISGHTVRICTIDLSADWKQVEAELLELVA